MELSISHCSSFTVFPMIWMPEIMLWQPSEDWKYKTSILYELKDPPSILPPAVARNRFLWESIKQDKCKVVPSQLQVSFKGLPEPKVVSRLSHSLTTGGHSCLHELVWSLFKFIYKFSLYNLPEHLVSQFNWMLGEKAFLSHCFNPAADNWGAF